MEMHKNQDWLEWGQMGISWNEQASMRRKKIEGGGLPPIFKDLPVLYRAPVKFPLQHNLIKTTLLRSN